MQSYLHPLLTASAVLAAVGCAPPPVLVGRGAETTTPPGFAKQRAPANTTTAPRADGTANTSTAFGEGNAGAEAGARSGIGEAGAEAATTGKQPDATTAATRLPGDRRGEAMPKMAEPPPVPESADAVATAPTKTAGLGRALRDGLVITGSTAHRLVHFTFDDGPDPRYTPALLDELDAARIKATFFFSANRFHGRSKRSRQAIELGREVLRRGHQVGSHSVRHARMSRMSRAEVVEQLDQSEQAFERVFGARTFLFRPPFGSRSAMVDRLLAARGYTRVEWNIGLADWVEREPEEILRTWKKVLKRNQKNEGELGGVVLMHDTDPRTVATFRLIIDDIRQRNCELLARSEELFDIVDDLSLFHAPRGEVPAGTDAPPAPVDEESFRKRQAELREAVRRRCSETGS